MTSPGRYINLDARLLDQELSGEIIDVTITSPPYWNLKDYQASNQIGFGQTKQDYLKDIKNLLASILKVTKSTGSMWIIVDSYRQNATLKLLPFELAQIAEQVGWKLRDLIIWDKQYSLPWQGKGHLRNTFEYILFFTKTDDFKYYVDRIKTLDELSKWWVDFPERFNPKGITPNNIWRIPTRSRGAWRRESGIDHSCSFPTALVARIVELTTDKGDLVLDPFAGSGIVLAQAAVMDRQYIGCDINATYIEMFHEFVLEEVARDWQELSASRRKYNDAKADFEQMIIRLRALKFARQATKPFVTLHNSELESPIIAILCHVNLPTAFERGQDLPVSIYIVTKLHSDKLSDASSVSMQRAGRPPLSQYGIAADIRVVTMLELTECLGQDDKPYYVYPQYKPRSFTASGNYQDLLRDDSLVIGAEENKIPMLANVDVDVAWVLEGYLD